MVDEIKAKATSWVPMEVDENPLSQYAPEDIRALLGAHPEEFTEAEGWIVERESNLAVPENFDSRDQWGSYIHPIRD